MKLRTSNHNLPVETGRWHSIPREERFCKLCDAKVVGDEFHYLFRCEALLQLRSAYLPIITYSDRHIQINKVLCKKSWNDLKNLKLFLNALFKMFK